jgi:hypothetical protein
MQPLEPESPSLEVEPAQRDLDVASDFSHVYRLCLGSELVTAED